MKADGTEDLLRGLLEVIGREDMHDVGSVTAPSMAPGFRRAPRSDPDGWRMLLHQPSGPRPATVDDGDRSAEHQPAGSETQPRTSEDMLPNSRNEPATSTDDDSSERHNWHTSGVQSTGEQF
jgi:hypothetical protein